MNDQDDESINELEVFLPKGSTRCTQDFSKFLNEFRSHTDFFFFVCQLVGQVDQTRIAAAKALMPGAQSEDERRRYQKSIDEPNLVLKKLQKHSKILSQNLTNGIVNSFQRYFSSIIQSAALKKPVILSSSQTIKFDDILKFTKHKDLVSFIVDRKINELSYGGLTDMEKYFDERLGIKMFNDNNERGLLRLFVEARNINVHNGGVVNEIFAGRVGKVEKFPYKIGDLLRFDLDDLVSLSSNAMKVAVGIDVAVSAKFKLRCQTHTAWQVNGKTR
ncbi:hypothetical protein [Sphingobium sp. B11D3A]|uniref:hypothetical protein n=1 Tax=Sphingobium sp. B11D3A TaxID=2940574 RepID=UPI0022241808|nr:hypothetical protein [Sphingobium sp. B11D3A]MCW2391940.1 hypothetical protein [Sphingobium sp. B11D3A]